MIMHFRVKKWERFVGLFVILALMILVGSLFFVARGQKWFEKRSTYVTFFHRVPGVKPGNPVTILGMDVGSVHSLNLSREGKVEVRLRILDSFRDYIRRDSEVSVVSSLLGGKTLEIRMGSPGLPPLPEGGVLGSQEPREWTDILREIDVREPLKKVEEALENLKSLAVRLNSPGGELFTILRNVEFLSAQLKEGRGTAGALLRDRTLYREAAAAVESANRSAARIEEIAARAAETSRALPGLVQQADGRIREIQVILADVQQAAARLPPILENVGRTAAEGPALAAVLGDLGRDLREIAEDLKKAAPELPGLVGRTRETVDDAHRLVGEVQDHWLIRRLLSAPRKEEPLEISLRRNPYEPKGEAPR